MIINTNLLVPNSTIVVGFSGGADSVCLLHALKEVAPAYNLTLIAAHLDHQWRTNSHEDASFCKTICKEWNIPFVSGSGSDYEKKIKKTGSKEDAGRRMRKAFFKKCIAQHDAQFLALGHHKNDVIENFFIKLIRGTTLAGLTGLKEKNKQIIRPLLHRPKADILKYVTHHNLTHKEDPSNNSELFLRNRIRLSVIPTLQACDQRASDNIIRTLSALQKTHIYITTLVLKTYQKLVVHTDPVALDLKAFLLLDSYMHFLIIEHFITQQAPDFTLSHNFIQEAIRFLHTNTNNASHELNPLWSLHKKDNTFWIKTKTLQSGITTLYKKGDSL